jgi:hypothetical protein
MIMPNILARGSRGGHTREEKRVLAVVLVYCDNILESIPKTPKVQQRKHSK